MNKIIYNIPLQHLATSNAERLIVRTADPQALVTALSAENPARIIAAQLTAPYANTEPLNAWSAGLPLELLLGDPLQEFPLLYHHVNLLEQHPVWILVPLLPGFTKAVKVALALNFAVRLDLGQPTQHQVAELLELLDFYLHQSSVAQSIDFFQGTLLGFYHQQPLPLWVIFDEPPHSLRYVAEDGRESLIGRLAAVDIKPQAVDSDLNAWVDEVLASAPACQSCAFRPNCGGYFQWPQQNYDCTGVKELFGVLQSAAEELRQDLQAAPSLYE